MRLIKSRWDERFCRVGWWTWADSCREQSAVCQAFSCTSPLETKEVLCLDISRGSRGVVESLALWRFHRRKRADLFSDWRVNAEPKAAFTIHSRCYCTCHSLKRPCPEVILTVGYCMLYRLHVFLNIIMLCIHTYISFKWKHCNSLFWLSTCCSKNSKQWLVIILFLFCSSLPIFHFLSLRWSCFRRVMLDGRPVQHFSYLIDRLRGAWVL